MVESIYNIKEIWILMNINYVYLLSLYYLSSAKMTANEMCEIRCHNDNRRFDNSISFVVYIFGL